MWNLLKFAFGIYISLVICIMIRIFKQQNTAKETEINNIGIQLIEVNFQMYNLQSTMYSLVTDYLKQIQELKCACEETFDCEIIKSSIYTIGYNQKNWVDADLSCKVQAQHSHLVSFETVDEQSKVIELISEKSSGCAGFWTSARKLSGEYWIWRSSRERVNDSLWHNGKRSGFGYCGYMSTDFPKYLLNDYNCWIKMCYICESPGDSTQE